MVARCLGLVVVALVAVCGAAVSSGSPASQTSSRPTTSQRGGRTAALQPPPATTDQDRKELSPSATVEPHDLPRWNHQRSVGEQEVVIQASKDSNSPRLRRAVVLDYSDSYQDNAAFPFRDNEYVDESAALASRLSVPVNLFKRADLTNNNKLYKILRSKSLGKKNIGIGSIRNGPNGRGLLGNGAFGRNSLGGLSSLRNPINSGNFNRNSLKTSTLERFPASNEEIDEINHQETPILNNNSIEDDGSDVILESKILSGSNTNPINSSNNNFNRGRSGLGSLISRSRFGNNNRLSNRLLGSSTSNRLLGSPTNNRLLGSLTSFIRPNQDSTHIDNESVVGRINNFDKENIDVAIPNQTISNTNLAKEIINTDRLGNTNFNKGMLGNNRDNVIENDDVEGSEEVDIKYPVNDIQEENHFNEPNTFNNEPEEDHSAENKIFNSGGLGRTLTSGSLGRGSLSLGRSSLLGSRGRGRGLSLSIDASMKVLRQALLFKSALLKQRQQLSRARQNHEYLQTIGKRSISP